LASAGSNFRLRCHRTLEKDRPAVDRTGATNGLISAAADRSRGLWQTAEVTLENDNDRDKAGINRFAGQH
jgi:hypothetical protein